MSIVRAAAAKKSKRKINNNQNSLYLKASKAILILKAMTVNMKSPQLRLNL
jgi:uncharacterized protein (UPF0147 family)